MGKPKPGHDTYLESMHGISDENNSYYMLS